MRISVSEEVSGEKNAYKQGSLEPEVLIDRLRNGENELRETLIKAYWNYIISTVSRMTGRRADSTDEFSVALQAFNEAIDSFDKSKNVSFISFAGIVINRRIIDHFRKNKRYHTEFPLSSLDDENGILNELPDQRAALSLSDKFEIQEELLSFKKALSDYGITMDSLVRLAPKHTDSRALCASIAKRLSEDSILSEKLDSDKRLPIAGILSDFSLSRKTIEKNRKYIIALYLILKSDMDIIKGYIESYMKEAGGQ